MRYIKKYEEHKINEELLGGVMNFLKGLWNKATAEIKKLGENPTPDQLKDWLEKNTFSKTSPNYIFKSVMDEFKKNPGANVQACMDQVDKIVGPTGVLGTTDMATFYASLVKVFGKNLAPSEIIKYYITTANNKVIKDIGYNTAKINTDIKDTTHLAPFKKILIPLAGDEKKQKDATIKYIEETILINLAKYIQDITPEEVAAYLKTKNIEAPAASKEEIKVGDIMTWTSKKGNKMELPIEKIEDDPKTPDDKTLVFKDNTGAEIRKKQSAVVKSEKNTEVNPEELTNILKDMKAKKPEDIAKVSSYAKFISDEANAGKEAEIDKIINPGATGA